MTPDEQGHPSNDVSRRTHLAAERTYLAWIRSGLSALAVSLAVGRLLPALLDVSRGPFLLLGAGYALMGLFLLGYGLVRHRSVEEALARGGSVAIPAAVVIWLTVLGLVLALGTFAVLFS
jgi:putative membrane protein